MSGAQAIWGKAIRPRLRVAEAVVLLLGARAAIAWMPFGWWRRLMGKIEAESPAVAADNSHGLRACRVARAVNRASTWIPITLVCLPRAMAVQWMLQRRRIPATLVFGVEDAPTLSARRGLHAWVEVDGETVIGADEARRYRPGLRLAHP